MTYRPRPIDTTGIELGEDLDALVEALAANVHEHWSEQRMSEGWTYGRGRDDAAKAHPDLVPYDQLPESEKAYDRLTVVQTLKAVVAMGYRIEKA